MRTGPGVEETYTAKSSYRVLRPDGTRTGLAVTPRLKPGPDDRVIEDKGAWGVTDVRTGAWLGGPYDSISRAQGLASRLSSLKWTAATLPPADREKAQNIIREYQGSPGSTEKPVTQAQTGETP
jgi:hypothetical protein